MKLIKVTIEYPNAIKSFYDKNRNIQKKSYDEQKKLYDYCAFGVSDFWSHSLSKFGYEAYEITQNAEPLQRMWAKENMLKNYKTIPLEQIVFEQIKKFKPDILLYDCYDPNLLKKIKCEINSIKLFIGWTGSAIVSEEVLKNIDIVFSCAEETVDQLNTNGIKAYHLNHAFDQRINERIDHSIEKKGIVFVGSLLSGAGYHNQREYILRRLLDNYDIEIYSDSFFISSYQKAYQLLRIGNYHLYRNIKKVPFGIYVRDKLPIIKRAANYSEEPKIKKADQKFGKHIKRGVYGLDMYQKICDSLIFVNIHADSSPRFASNMKLFEATGVGTCLLTDWKENINDLFLDSEEIITYKSDEECVEKISWLLLNPNKVREIGNQGKLKCEKSHNYFQRAKLFDEIVRHELDK